MKILSLQISNILSFQYFENIADAEKITFSDELNIIIGENGAGKSTALEVINFIFKRVFYKQFIVNQDLYEKRDSSISDDRKRILTPTNTNNSFKDFRLDPNWYSENALQKIRIEIKLDDIDLSNISKIQSNLGAINNFIQYYTHHAGTGSATIGDTYVFDIALDKNNNTFSVDFINCEGDFGYEYVSDYNFYKEAISLYNLEHPNAPLAELLESFTLISSYRNYHSFSKSISLKDKEPSVQLQEFRKLDYAKSMNTSDKNEPSIFGVVRLRVAEKHFHLMSDKLSELECEELANKLEFIIAINERLKVINLECKIKLISKRSWQYNFEFFDLRRSQAIADINSLSAGQKAIIHLVFEAYGRGEVKGGLVIIDEPEIHLHYQFQHEYLQVINDLNRDQKCQYILVTHSESLINSTTINYVKRFSLNNDGYTQIMSPNLTTDQRMLIKILDNTRSTYAFFAKKVLLVEGDTDRYFFKSVIQELYPSFDQEIAVLYMGGKGGYNEWSSLFNQFGLEVYFISDFDFIINRFYPKEKGVALKTQKNILDFKTRNPDWESKIDLDYFNNIFILKNGDLEHYLTLSKKSLTSVIDFCNNSLVAFLNKKTDNRSLEILNIIKQLVQ